MIDLAKLVRGTSYELRPQPRNPRVVVIYHGERALAHYDGGDTLHLTRRVAASTAFPIERFTSRGSGHWRFTSYRDARRLLREAESHI
jgi:hypothetical protein